jgi:NTP pyrophosphatase (non-canonical NTP hydrolase)
MGDLVGDLRLLNQALDRRFPDGRDPFQMVTRLAEECGELAREVNHFERTGVKTEKHGEPDRAKLAKEVRDVLLCALQIAAYYDSETELEEVIAESIRRARAEGLID